MSIHLFGSFTSPYVRRVRIVLAELGLPFQFTDTTTDAGQAALRATTPLWKVPVAVINGETVFDSAVIIQRVLQEYGPGPIAPYQAADWQSRNLVTVTDGVLDSLINAFYLQKDGVTADQAPYVKKQNDRAVAAMNWLEQRANGPLLLSNKSFGLVEVALLTALEWMRFRQTYPLANHPKLTEFLAAHDERPSVHATKPPV